MRKLEMFKSRSKVMKRNQRPFLRLRRYNLRWLIRINHRVRVPKVRKKSSLMFKLTSHSLLKIA